MAVVLVMLLVGGVVGIVVLALGLRTWGVGQAKTEARLLSPDTHKVRYVVPLGQDPAILMAAVSSAGYTALVDTSGGTERLLVACGEQDRAKVRSVLEHVSRSGFDGVEMRVDHVAFDDE